MAFKKNFKEGFHCGEMALTKTEQDKILISCKTLYDKILIELAIATAARRDDLINIEWKNIDFQNNSITFSEKKKKRLHTIYFGDKFKQDLLQFKHLMPQKAKYVLCKQYKEKDGIRFDADQHISSRTIYNYYNDIRKNAGFTTNVGFHSLRATAAKRGYEAGWSLLEVSNLLGDSPATVQKYYLVVSPGQMQDVAKSKELV